METMGALGKLGGLHLSEQPRQVPQVRELNRPPLKQIPPPPTPTPLHLRNTDQSQEGLFWMGGRQPELGGLLLPPLWAWDRLV